MTFIHQALVWGFLLALVPLLIHLINLMRHRRVKWAAMEFLLKSHKKHRKWVWLKQLLLLLMRMAAVALLVFLTWAAAAYAAVGTDSVEPSALAGSAAELGTDRPLVDGPIPRLSLSPFGTLAEDDCVMCRCAPRDMDAIDTRMRCEVGTDVDPAIGERDVPVVCERGEYLFHELAEIVVHGVHLQYHDLALVEHRREHVIRSDR